jgi:hypothetical protein
MITASKRKQTEPLFGIKQAIQLTANSVHVHGKTVSRMLEERE